MERDVEKVDAIQFQLKWTAGAVACLGNSGVIRPVKLGYLEIAL